jgi:hypothetical protein
MLSFLFYAFITLYLIIGISVAIWAYKHIENMKRLSKKNESPETIVQKIIRYFEFYEIRVNIIYLK